VAFAGDRLPIKVWQRDFSPVFKAALEAATPPPVVDLEEVYRVLMLVRDCYNGGVWGGWADRWYANCPGSNSNTEVTAAMKAAFNDTPIIGYQLSMAIVAISSAAYYASNPRPNWKKITKLVGTTLIYLEGYGTLGCADCNRLDKFPVACNNCKKFA
jgi:hypothetical protein